MPGLLQTPDSHFGWAKFVVALVAEFLGTALFAFCGSATPTGTSSQQGVILDGAQQANWNLGLRNLCQAPWGNGITLAILVFATANISGGHLNPAVTAATIVTGHMSPLKGLMYIITQLGGGCCGILLVAGLVPGARVGMGNAGIGCFHSSEGITQGQLFGWELIMTFILVSVVYAVAVGEPHFGNVGPIAVGLTLFAMVFAGSTYTGTSINPARSFGPAAVYQCYWNQVWLYCIAEFAGGILAGLAAGPLYGVGAPWLGKILPWVHPQDGLLNEPNNNAMQTPDDDDKNAEPAADREAKRAARSRPDRPDRLLLDSGNIRDWSVWKRGKAKGRPKSDARASAPEDMTAGAVNRNENAGHNV
ncbi:hypothetical protein WJX73_004701 [Symbiochloris irregularis]|uniref:Uncharacterized protein n=1 Tax=Symbiochloris irregularis TaxID=706552 RepID=A0AAW1P7P7_9CHLO